MHELLEGLQISNAKGVRRVIDHAANGTETGQGGYVTLAQVSSGPGRKEVSLGRLDGGTEAQISSFLREKISDRWSGKFRLHSYQGKLGGKTSATFNVTAPARGDVMRSTLPEGDTKVAPPQADQQPQAMARPLVDPPRPGEPSPQLPGSSVVQVREQAREVERLVAEAAKLRHERADAQRERDRIRDDRDRLRHDLRTRDREVRAHSHQQTEARRAVELEHRRLRQSNDELRNMLAKASSRYEEEIEMVDKDRMRLRAKLIGIERENEELRREVARLRAQSAAMMGQLATFQRRIDEVDDGGFQDGGDGDDEWFEYEEDGEDEDSW